MTNRTERKKAKLRFAALYAISLFLLFILATAFWQRLAPRGANVRPQASETEGWFLQTDTALHAKMQALDGLAEGYVRARKAGAQTDTVSWFVLRRSVLKTLDSLDQQAGFLSEGPKKTAMNSVAANFRKSLENRQALMAGVLALPKEALPAAVSINNVALDSLKQLVIDREAVIASLQKQAALASSTTGSATAGLQAAVAERDRSIASLQTQVASLQNQLRQKDAALQAASASKPADYSGKDKTIATLQNQVSLLQSQLRQKEAELRTTSSAARPAVNNGGEWQQKYQSLKSSYDKIAASEKSLKSAYQTLADDNRRLLSQLQAARKG